MIIKVCGLREPENLRAVEDCGADWTGLISYPRSPRHVPADALLPPARTMRWGVFVNAPLPDIVRCAAAWGLRGVQLHGQESPALCRALRRILPPPRANITDRLIHRQINMLHRPGNDPPSSHSLSRLHAVRRRHPTTQTCHLPIHPYAPLHNHLIRLSAGHPQTFRQKPVQPYLLIHATIIL